MTIFILCAGLAAQGSGLPEGRLLLLVGLGDLKPEEPRLLLNVGNDPAEGPMRHYFDQHNADGQRSQETPIGKGRPPEGYCDGTPYQLRGDAGEPLPIYWLPWCARETVARAAELGITITESDVAAAREAARSGRDYDPRHIQGAWVYADPEFWSPVGQGFTERDLAGARKAYGQVGDRAVVCTVERSKRAQLEDYTGKYVDWPLCLVLDGEILSAPRVMSPLYDSIMITGGGSGFTEEEQDHLIDCLRIGGVALDPDVPAESTRFGMSLPMLITIGAVFVVAFGLLAILVRRRPLV